MYMVEIWSQKQGGTAIIVIFVTVADLSEFSYATF